MATKKEQKTKKVKARILNEDGDLTWGLIEVPADDRRKEFNPETDSLEDRKGPRTGNPLKNSRDGVSA